MIILLAFKQARETQDYSSGNNTTASCGVRGAESATAAKSQPQPNTCERVSMYKYQVKSRQSKSLNLCMSHPLPASPIVKK